MKGLCGRLIRINLADGGIDVEPVEEGLARKYLGGKALAAYYAISEIKKGTDPLGPENKLYLFTGTLTGTPALLGNRTVAATKSPSTGTFTDSYMGGFWGPELKFAPLVKGLEIPSYDPRSGEGTALSYARCERGADHLKPWVFNKEWLSSSERTDPFSTTDKPSLIKRENERSAILDCLCVCR